MTRHIATQASLPLISSIVDSFPKPISFCFGYGSGVLSQGKAQINENTQIDLIFGVDDPIAWHHENLLRNPSHYSGIRYFGASRIAWIQEQLGAGVYFNPFVRINGSLVKYGVVDISTLCNDLSHWETLYLAGRLQKPVRLVLPHEQVLHCQQQNLLSALAVALLLLPEHFTERDLYQQIASISYMGDVRMAIAEHPRKIENIVDHQFNGFRGLYAPLVKKMAVEILPDKTYRQRKEVKFLLTLLASSFRDKLSHYALLDRKNEDLQRIVSQAVRDTVSWPSLTQTIKGLVTAGISRTITYSVEKLKKRWT